MVHGIATLQPASLPNTCQYEIQTERGDFLVQIAWPLAWSADGVPPEDDGEPQTFFLVDGNAYFYTAVDVSRRMEYLYKHRTVVVGVGYPRPTAVYDYRRGPDLTPASRDGEYEMPLDKHGKPRTDLSFGKAQEFLDLLQTDVMEHVYEKLLPIPSLINGRKALFGHSYGGIFSLYVLFTAPQLFDTVIAGSPIIWWNRNFLLDVHEAEFRANTEMLTSPPSLLCTWGLNQHECVQRADESDAHFQTRLGIAEDPQMKDSVTQMAARLKDSGRLKSVMTHEFVDEDHGSSAVTAVQMAVMQFLWKQI